MYIPAAMQLEQAADELKRLPSSVRSDQINELRSFGAERLQELGATGFSDDAKVAYELGLQTARVMIRMNVKVIQAGIDPEDIL